MFGNGYTKLCPTSRDCPPNPHKMPPLTLQKPQCPKKQKSPFPDPHTPNRRPFIHAPDHPKSKHSTPRRLLTHMQIYPMPKIYKSNNRRRLCPQHCAHMRP